MEVKLFIPIYLNLMSLDQDIELGLHFRSYLGLLRVLLERVSFLGQSGFFRLLELLNVTSQI